MEGDSTMAVQLVVLKLDELTAYFNDVIIKTESESEHMKVLDRVGKMGS